MKNTKYKLMLAGLGVVLAACSPDLPVNPAAGQSRFDIEAYHEIDSNADLQGLWLAVHEGTLHQTSGDVDYTITGFIREVIEIRQHDGEYFLRTCVEPEHEQTLDIFDGKIRVQINADLAEFDWESNTFLQGVASHDDSDSDYNGTVAMKKIAAFGEWLGSFHFYSAEHQEQLLDASCFQEGKLQVVGTMLGISQWANVDILSVSSWEETGAFHRLSYLVSREGNADPVRELTFVDGELGNASLVSREYADSLSVSTISAGVNYYQSSFAVDDVINGVVNIDYSMGDELVGEDVVVDVSSTEPEVQQGQSWGNWMDYFVTWGEWLGLGSWWHL